VVADITKNSINYTTCNQNLQEDVVILKRKWD